ncbi:MAG: phosphoribosylglycinamide formyltransferase, partial [Nitriliruptoraceae bacterium]|nr:phosphoribosylglycinamide formyltransferase [Nitriliruptoraceae bacterium]
GGGGARQPRAGGAPPRAGAPASAPGPRPRAGGDDRDAWEARLRADLHAHDVEVVVLAGFMRILSGAFLHGWPDRVLNVHPSLLPAFRGAHAVRDALAYGVSVTGVTVHLVDEEVDHGPIVAQVPVAVHADDTESSLHARLQAVEHELLPRCVRWLCRGELAIDGRRVLRSGVASAWEPIAGSDAP